jgi:guanylate kinase
VSRFIVLCGPSCIGKGPLFSALRRFYPELTQRLKPLVLFNDRDPRPGEEDGVDYHFRPRTEIERLGERSDFVVVDVRGDLQALEIESIQHIMDEGFDAFFEGNPFVPARLREAGVFERFDTLSVFLSPLSREEILHLKAPERRVNLGKFVTDIQRRKLLHRTKRQKVILSLKDLENIETRAVSAFREMREGWTCDHVIPVYDGEGNDNWDAFYYPIGSARNALETFAALLRGESPEGIEKWEESLIEDAS